MPSPRRFHAGHPEENLARPHTVGCRCMLPAPYGTNAIFHMSPAGCGNIPRLDPENRSRSAPQRWAQRLLLLSDGDSSGYICVAVAWSS